MADGNIDNLNFEVILHNDKFKDTVEETRKIAKQLNEDLSKVLDVYGKVRGKTLITRDSVTNAKDLNEALGELANTISGLPSSMKIVTDDTEKSADNVGKMNDKLVQTRDLLGDLSRLTGITFGAAGFRSFLGTLVNVTGEFEVQKMAMASMLQDAGKADKIFNELRQNALKSPYTFQDLSKYAKQLMAFGIDADKLLDTEKKLADVAAGLGVDVGRIILAYGQVKSAGVLKGTELRQFTEAGVPLLESLAKQIEETTGKTISLAKVFEMISKKQIPFAMVEEAFRRMTSEGGKFYNMQEVLVNTLQGKIGKLRDTWQQVLYDVGSGTKMLKKVVDGITAVVSNINKFGTVIESIIFTFGSYTAALSLAATAQQIAFGVQAIKRLSEYAKMLKTVTDITKKYAIISQLAKTSAFALGAAAGAIYLVVRAIQNANEAQRRLNAAIVDTEDKISKEISKLDVLAAKLDVAKKGTKEYDDAKKAIVDNYGRYFQGLDKEIEKVGLTKEAYDKLSESVAKSIKIRQYSEFEANEKKSFDQAVKERIDDAIKTQKKGGALGVYLQEAVGKLTTENWATEFNKFINDEKIISLVSKTESINNQALLNRIRKVFKTAATERERYLSNTKEIREYLDLPEDILDSLDNNDGPKGPDWNPEPKYNKQIAAIKKKIAVLERYKNALDSFEQVVGRGQALKEVANIFDPDGKLGINFETLDTQIEKLIGDLRALGEEGREAAEQEESRLGLGDANKRLKELKDEEKELEKAVKKANEYREIIRSWSTEDTDLQGKGFWFDISKVASDLETKLNKLAVKGQKAKEILARIDTSDEKAKARVIKDMMESGMTEKEAKEFWDTWIANGLEAIDKLIKDGGEKAKAAAKEKTTSLAKTWLEEEFTLRGINFDNLSDRTLGQLKELKEKVQGLLKDINPESAWLGPEGIDIRGLVGVDLDDKDRNKWLSDLSEGEISVLKLMQAIYQATGSVEDFKDAVGKILGGKTKDLSDEEKKAFSKVAKAMINDINSLVGKFQELADVAGKDGLASVLSAVQGLGDVLGNVVQGFKNGGVWGAVIAGVTSVGEKFVEAWTEAEELKKKIREVAEESRIANFESRMKEGTENIFGSSDWRKMQNAVREMSKLQEKLAADRAKGTVTNKVGVLKVDRDKLGIEQMMKDLGYDLLDEYGNLNSEGLQKILDTYTNLKSADKEWIQQAINNSEMYKKAMEDLDDVMESIFGDLAASAADSIVDKWKEAGDAALDYADILDDVATKYAKMLVQSMLLDEVFTDDFKKELRGYLQTDQMGEAMRMVEESMESIVEMAPRIESALSPLYKYTKPGTSTSGGSLSSGIQKEVEENSGLMASYMNAMRADLSVIRGMQQNGWQDVKAIREAMQAGSAPSYQVYMAQIAGDTHDMMLGQQTMLEKVSRLAGTVTASSSGGNAIRTTR